MAHVTAVPEILATAATRFGGHRIDAQRGRNGSRNPDDQGAGGGRG